MTANIQPPFLIELLCNKAVMQHQGAISDTEDLVLVTFKSTRYIKNGEVLNLAETQPAITLAAPVQIPMPFVLISECRLAVSDPTPGRMAFINAALSGFNGAFGGVLAGIVLQIDQVIWEDL